MGSGSSTDNSRGRRSSILSSLDDAYTWVVSGEAVVTTRTVGSSEGSDDEDESPGNEEKEQPDNRPVKPVKPKKPLKIKNIDVNVQKNTEEHHTKDYDITRPCNDDGVKQTPQLIVRRGETFDISLVFNRKYNPDEDEILIYFETGKLPRHGQRSLQILDVAKGVKNVREWGAGVDCVNENCVTLKIRPAPNCIIGKWRTSIHCSVKKTRVNGKEIVNRYKHEFPIYILFNAWCECDQVYMKDDNLRKEYVLNQNGRIFTGNYQQITYRNWVFGQFEENILDCVLYLLDESKLKDSSKGNAVMITRTVSARINSNDDNGVLVGNWSGSYDDGTSPTVWNGSVAILEEYLRTKKPVKYGQCWVFSGLCTSVCRAIGIPTRTVTNFSSAHDTDGSATIDCYFKMTEDGTYDPVKHLNNDSVWNFHVWNESWMKRADLPNGMDGWQVFDATPQEASDGVYCAGPAPVNAIKQGLVNNNYDATFIFAEVNADKIHYIIDDSKTCIAKVKSNSVGKCISTKVPDGVRTNFKDKRMDITCNYKFAEGSSEERTAVRKAQLGAKMHDVPDSESKDVDFDIYEKDHILVGSNFNVILKLKNKSRHMRTVIGKMVIKTIYYTGVVKSEVKTHTFGVQLKPLKTDEVVCLVAMEEYLHLIVDQASFSIDVTASVVETDQKYADNDVYRLRRPDLDVTAPSEVKVGDNITVTIKLQNTMPDPLTKCTWDIEGAALYKAHTIECGDVEPYGHAETSVTITAKRPGKKIINASFDSKELKDVSGSCEVEVVP